jgi:hypothetical protein
MHQRTLVQRTLWAALALGIAASTEGCYGTPRTGLHDGSTSDDSEAGGAGGAAGGGGAGGAADGGATGCPSACPGPTTGPATGVGACVNDECRISCSATYPTLCAAAQSCVDLTSDVKNCGACGHDCLGGACTDSQCQPVMIAQYIGAPMIIYVGAQAVYVTTETGYVGRANKDGSDLKAPARPGFASPGFPGTTIAEDGERVFLTRNDGSVIHVSYCLTTGCDSTARPIGGEYTQHFAVDQLNHKIVWVDYSPSRLVSASTVGSVSGIDVPGGALESGTSGSRLLCAHDGIYFADGNDVRRVPVAGGSMTVVTSGNAPLAILGANSTSLFLYDGSAIGSVPLPNGDGLSPKPLITAHGRFAADDRSMYWASNSGVATTCQISDCQRTQRILPKRDIDMIYDVGIDDAAVYWFALSGTVEGAKLCTVWKMAK